jgi:hypothetical protein
LGQAASAENFKKKYMGLQNWIKSHFKNRTLVVESETVSVGIAFPGRREVVEIKLSDKVIDLKRKVEAVVGIKVQDQIMVFHNKTMKDHRTLKHYKVQNDRTIQLKGDHSSFVLVSPMDPTLQKINERMEAKGSKISTSAQPSTSPDVPVKEQPKPEPIVEISLTYTFKFHNKFVEAVAISKYSTAAELEAQVKKLAKLDNISKHVLVRASAPKGTRTSLLTNLWTPLEDLDIDGETLELRPLNSTFKVSLPAGAVLTMDFDCDADVSKLILALVELNIDDPENLVLLQDGDAVPLKGTLRELGITTGSYLDLKRRADHEDKLKVRVEWDSGHVEAHVSPDMEMWDLMKIVEEAGGGNAQRMTLTNADGDDLDEEGSLKDWSVKNGDVLRARV